MSRESVYKALEMGRISREPDGLFDLEQLLQDWDGNTHPLIWEWLSIFSMDGRLYGFIILQS